MLDAFASEGLGIFCVMLTALKEIVCALPQAKDRLNLENWLSEQKTLRYNDVICRSWSLISRTSRRFQVACRSCRLTAEWFRLAAKKEKDAGGLQPAWIRAAGRSAESGTNLLRVAFVQAALGTKLSVSGEVGDELEGLW